jgi:hypothetical protein
LREQLRGKAAGQHQNRRERHRGDAKDQTHFTPPSIPQETSLGMRRACGLPPTGPSFVRTR